jgi:AcrR family transcriptional regulator
VTVRKSKTRAPRAGRKVLSREAWIEAARQQLLAKGVSAIKIGALARKLHMTRGSFYWHFKSHDELLSALLEYWEDRNTRPFEEAMEGGGRRVGYDEFLRIVSVYVEEQSYSPAFDTAVRDWARASKSAAAAIRRVDAKRIDILHAVFRDLGYADPEAMVRARITYFHQVGYYAVNLREEPEARKALVPVYIQVLAGKLVTPGITDPTPGQT